MSEPVPEQVPVAVLRTPGNEDLPLPAYASAGAGGLDLRAAVLSPLVLAPIARVRWEETRELPASARGAAGFGSTGTE